MSSFHKSTSLLLHPAQARTVIISLLLSAGLTATRASMLEACNALAWAAALLGSADGLVDQLEAELALLSCFGMPPRAQKSKVAA